MSSSRFIGIASICGAAIVLGAAHRTVSPARAEYIAPNDNVHRAGHLKNGVLTAAIEARSGEWQPLESEGETFSTAAFAEVGGSLQTPGPLLRAPVGTEIRVTLHNALAVPMWVYGLGERRGYADSVQLGAGETREMHFRATTPGISYYAARTTKSPVSFRLTDDSQLSGVIVIDPPGAMQSDRIFAITEWFTIDGTTKSGIGPKSILAFNGLGWPHTPRLELAQGDTVHWRFVNLTGLEHPLHLHGAFFRVDAKGDGTLDSIFAPDDRRLAVTETVLPGQTMSMTWSPLHSGNWVFHCHIASHITKPEFFESDRHMPPPTADGRMSMSDQQHMQRMGGLVLGIRVSPRGPQESAQPVSRQIRLLVRSRANVYGEYPGYGYVDGDSPMAQMRDSFTAPGPTLELTRGKRVAVTIVNQSHEAAAIHWHGIELESLPDGVPGWSGMGSATLPFVLPGDSLTVRFTAPRSGTFMYHSHSNEMQQIASGLYGAIIVRDPGAHIDSTDHVLLFSDGGPIINLIKDDPPLLLNGKLNPDTLTVTAGHASRLRMINIRSDISISLVLEQDGKPIPWRIIAKDGASLPTHQIRARPAPLGMEPGETFDAELSPATRGTIILKYTDNPTDSTAMHRAVIRVN